MKIEIETDGIGRNTKISFNGVQQKGVLEFDFSAKTGGKCKLVLVRTDSNGDVIPLSFFGGDFEKFDLKSKASLPPMGEK